MNVDRRRQKRSEKNVIRQRGPLQGDVRPTSITEWQNQISHRIALLSRERELVKMMFKFEKVMHRTR